MLQELGLHEVGLPSQELLEELAKLAPEYEVRASRLHIALPGHYLPVLPVGLPA